MLAKDRCLLGLEGFAGFNLNALHDSRTQSGPRPGQPGFRMRMMSMAEKFRNAKATSAQGLRCLEVTDRCLLPPPGRTQTC